MLDTPKQRYAIVDDNTILTMAWELEATLFNQQLSIYNSSDAFMENCSTLSKDTTIYIDLNLGGHMDGLSLSRWASEQGFAEIYLISGTEDVSANTTPWLKGILSDKTPPFNRTLYDCEKDTRHDILTQTE